MYTASFLSSRNVVARSFIAYNVVEVSPGGREANVISMMNARCLTASTSQHSAAALPLRGKQYPLTCVNVLDLFWYARKFEMRWLQSFQLTYIIQPEGRRTSRAWM